MDSQLTLVDSRSNSVPPPTENTLFVFDRDDMQNTTLRSRGSCYPSYVLSTAQNTTILYAGNGVRIATVTRRLLRRDQILFPGRKPMNLSSWLRAPMLSPLPLAFHVCGRHFKWKKSFSGQLLMYETSRSADVVAWFSKGRRHHMDGSFHPTYLAIKPEMVELKDMIVLSCILAEHKLRVNMDSQIEKGALYYAMRLSHGYPS